MAKLTKFNLFTPKMPPYEKYTEGQITAGWQQMISPANVCLQTRRTQPRAHKLKLAATHSHTTLLLSV